MRILKNTFDRSWLCRSGAAALVAGMTLLSSAATFSFAQAVPDDHKRPTDIVEQLTYRSPEDAARALYLALQDDNEPALRAILGAGNELISSGDPATDMIDRKRFARKYLEMHRLAPQSDGSMALYIGAENWPFPMPLVSSRSAWRFDSDTGAAEILSRQIGENEIAAIRICHVLADAQRRSGALKQPSSPEEADPLITTLLSSARGGGNAVAFHGYTFRILSRSGNGFGFAAVAYPAAYRASGVATFVVDQWGAVYEKDLGPASARAAQSMNQSRPDSTWAPVDYANTP